MNEERMLINSLHTRSLPNLVSFVMSSLFCEYIILDIKFAIENLACRIKCYPLKRMLTNQTFLSYYLIYNLGSQRVTVKSTYRIEDCIECRFSVK